MYAKIIAATAFLATLVTGTAAHADTCWSGWYTNSPITSIPCTFTPANTAWFKVFRALPSSVTLPADPIWVAVPMSVVQPGMIVSYFPAFNGYESDGRPRFVHGGTSCTGCTGVKVWRNSPLQDVAFCADEHGVCTFSGVRFVTYGADGHFVTKVANGSIACDNATFGDPAYGAWKHCWVGSTPLTICTNEHGTCFWNYGAARIAYGAGDKFFVNEVYQDSVSCSNSTWGDPNVGVYKSCYVW